MKTTTRRDFLVRGAQAAAILTAAPALATSHPPSAGWSIEAVPTQESFGDGSTVPYLRFRSVAGTATKGQVPFLAAEEGSLVSLTVTNRLPMDLKIGVVGVGTGPRVPAGTQRTVQFRMPPAGSYLLRDTLLGIASGPLGLSAVLVSRPSSGQQELWTGGPMYDREYILHYQDSDSRWNDAVAASGRPNLNQYEPNFFTINGISYAETISDPDTYVLCQLGERVLLRMSNSGRMRHSIHFHGYHVETMARNNIANTTLPPKDTVEVPADGTTDVIFTAHQTGIYPIHPHSLTAVTANGLYPYGQLTLIETV